MTFRVYRSANARSQAKLLDACCYRLSASRTADWTDEIVGDMSLKEALPLVSLSLGRFCSLVTIQQVRHVSRN